MVAACSTSLSWLAFPKSFQRREELRMFSSWHLDSTNEHSVAEHIAAKHWSAAAALLAPRVQLHTVSIGLCWLFRGHITNPRPFHARLEPAESRFPARGVR